MPYSPTEGTPLTSMHGVHEPASPTIPTAYSSASERGAPLRHSLSPGNISVNAGGPRPTSISHLSLEIAHDYDRYGPPPTTPPVLTPPVPTPPAGRAVSPSDYDNPSAAAAGGNRKAPSILTEPTIVRERTGSGEIMGLTPSGNVAHLTAEERGFVNNSFGNPDPLAPPTSALPSRQQSSVLGALRASLPARRGSGNDNLLYPQTGELTPPTNGDGSPHGSLHPVERIINADEGIPPAQSSTLPTPYGSKWSRLMSSLKRKIPVFVEWGLQPAHMAILWLCLIIIIAGAAVAFVTINLVKVTSQEKKDITEYCSQILCYIFTLNAIANHPQRFVWLFQKVFRRHGKRAYFDRYFPFDAEYSWWHTWLILILLHLNCCSQYVIQAMLSCYGPDNRPNPVVYTMLVTSMLSGVIGCFIHGRWAKKYLESKIELPCNSSANSLNNAVCSEKMQSYEAMLVQARNLHQHEWRVTIRVERPGQPPLQYNTTDEAYGGNPVTTYYAATRDSSRRQSKDMSYVPTVPRAFRSFGGPTPASTPNVVIVPATKHHSEVVPT